MILFLCNVAIPITNEKLKLNSVAEIPSTQVVPPSSSPIFFGAAKQDRICLPEIGYQTFSDKSFNNHTVTTHEYDADHWLILSKPDEINRDLEAWIESSGIEAN